MDVRDYRQKSRSVAGDCYRIDIYILGRFYPYYLHKMVILYNCFTQRKKIILPLHHVGGVNEQTKHAVFELACSTLPSFLHPAWTIH